MNVLAIDTAGEAMGLALATHGGRRLQFVERAGLRHAELLAPSIAALLAQGETRASELDLVVCSTGPGSFTGVRIGIATAKGLALGAGCAAVGIAVLDALAWRFSFFAGYVVPVADAKKGRLYAAAYLRGERSSAYLDLAPSELARHLVESTGGAPILLTGPEAAQLRSSLERARTEGGSSFDISADPAAPDTDPEALLELGILRFQSSGDDRAGLAPLYLRASEAELSPHRQAGPPGGR